MISDSMRVERGSISTICVAPFVSCDEQSGLFCFWFHQSDPGYGFEHFHENIQTSASNINYLFIHHFGVDRNVMRISESFTISQFRW